MRKKFLQIKNLNRYNLDVWGFFIWKNKYNRNLKGFLFSFEIILRRTYYNNFFILRKNFILFNHLRNVLFTKKKNF